MTTCPRCGRHPQTPHDCMEVTDASALDRLHPHPANRPEGTT